MTGTKELSECPRPKDTTISLSSGIVIDTWINKSIFTIDGELNKEQEFTEVDNMDLLSFKWPEDIKFTTKIQWTPEVTVRVRSSERKREFAETTAQELGLNQWEMVKHVMERCLADFEAYLLDVSFWGVTLGFKNDTAALSAQHKADPVLYVLVCLFADTEYLFRDVMVKWTRSLSYLPGTARPVQETPSITTQEPCAGEVTSDVAHFSRGSSRQHQQQLDRLDIDQKGLLHEVLEELREIKLSVYSLEHKVDENHNEVCRRLEENWNIRVRPDMLPLQHAEDSAGRLMLEPSDQQQTLIENRASLMVAQSLRRSTSTGQLELLSPGQDTQRTDPALTQAASPRPQQQQERGRTPPMKHNYTQTTTSESNSSIEDWHPASENSSEPRSLQGPRSMDNSQSGGSSLQLITGDINSATWDEGKPKIKDNHNKNSIKDNNFSSRSAEGHRKSSTWGRSNHSQNTRSTHTSPNTSPPASMSASQSLSNTASSNFSSTSRPQSSPSGPQPPLSEPPPSTSQPSQPSASQSASQQSLSRKRGPSRPTMFQSYSVTGGGGRQKETFHNQTSPPSGSSTPANHQPGVGREDKAYPKESITSQGKSSANSGGRHTKSESHSHTTKLLLESDAEARLVRRSVERAYRQDEVKPPKAKSFDTMLCLDISDSMKQGGAFEQMKSTVLQLIEGVEDIVTKFGVEENMGLVTFGGRAEVKQNLTNDFNLIRDQIELLEPGGKSPFIEALLVAMAAFVKKGGIVSISGEWQVKPRVIFISDGWPTESSEDNNTDEPGDIDNVRLALSNLLMSFKTGDKMYKVHPIFFIPVGDKADKGSMEIMSKLCGGVYLEPDNVHQLCHYFRVQETIGKVMACLRRESEELSPEKIDAALMALTPDLSDTEKAEVIDVVHRELNNPNRVRTRRVRPSDLENVYEDTERVKKGRKLPLGTRVIRGPDWCYDDQDKGGPGTVINHHGEHSVHWVYWDHGDYNRYGFSENRGYHIMMTDDHPRLQRGDESLEIGMAVKKGKDWTPAEDLPEQGEGPGIIIRKNNNKVLVRWSNGVMQVCRWTPVDSQEVEYSPPHGEADNTEPPPQSQPKSEPSDSWSWPATGTFEGEGRWQWCDENYTWHFYDVETNHQIETVCKRNTRTCLIQRDGKQRRVMFRKMVEKVVDEGQEYKIRRLPKRSEH